MQIKKHGVVVRRKILFWEKRRWGDWQKEFMWTVQRITENAVSSPNYFSLPHPPSCLKNQIPPSLFPLLSHPLSQTWIGNTPALRCFDSRIFKAWSPQVHLFLLSSHRLHLPATVGPLALPVEESQLIPRGSVAYLMKQVAIISPLLFSWEPGKKISCSMHLTSAQHCNAHPWLSFANCLYHTFTSKD